MVRIWEIIANFVIGLISIAQYGEAIQQIRSITMELNCKTYQNIAKAVLCKNILVAKGWLFGVFDGLAQPYIEKYYG